MAKIKETAVVKQFTMAGIGFGPDALSEYVNSHPGENAVVNVMAFATGYKEIENKKDPTKISLRFEGAFEIVNRITGEVTRSGLAYFPGVVEAFLKGQVDMLESGGTRQAILILVRKVSMKESNTGYKFAMKTFVDEESAQDPFLEMRSMFPEVKTLPAGKKAATVAA